jgi:hypothetical protein
MTKIVTVELLKGGDRFEFTTTRSEWADNCFLPHPTGVIVVAKSAFFDSYKQCRFGYLLERFPNGKPQEWWGAPQIEVRLLDRLPSVPTENVKKPVTKLDRLERTITRRQHRRALAS